MSIVAIDLDDVLFDFIGKFTEMANKKFGKPALGTPPVDWEWSNFGLSKDEITDIWNDIHVATNFWETINVEAGVNRGLIAAVDALHTVYFPTARATTVGRSTGKQSARALRKHFDLAFPTVFVSNEKGPLATALKYDFFIDDRPKNCLDVKAALPECSVFLKNSPHNLAWTPSDNIQRVPSVNEFCEIVLGKG